MTHTNNAFELATIEPVARVDGKQLSQGLNFLIFKYNSLNILIESIGKILGLFNNHGNSIEDDVLRLRGQMVFVRELESLVFLSTPV